MEKRQRLREQREGRNQFFSRSGDMLFETNAEFRYNIATIIPNTLVIRGAFFADIGNVWNLPNKTNRGNDTVVFRIKNLYANLCWLALSFFYYQNLIDYQWLR